MARHLIIAGNWKMNAKLGEARALAQAVVKSIGSGGEAEVVLCPPFTALAAVSDVVKGSRVLLGAQDLHWEPAGAYTGEICAAMLKDVGCRYCIVGHSERRHLFGETDSAIHQKASAALREGLRAILCVGETLQERQRGQTWVVVERQLKIALEGMEPLTLEKEVVIAYEPVWAIGTGQNATPAQAQEVHAAIRGWLADKIGRAHAQSTRIQYGGSVNPKNAGELMTQPDVDGALVGGASLEAKSFISIVESALHAKGAKCSTAPS